MKRIVFALALGLVAAPLHAETIEAAGTILSVTLYPEGAMVLRRVNFSAPAGTHALIVPGLPAETDPIGLRVTGGDGIAVGTIGLAQGRLPATDDKPSAEVAAAKDEVTRLDAVLRDKRAVVATARAKGQAAAARASFFQGVARQQAGMSAEGADLKALADLVGTETFTAKQDEIAAEETAVTLEQALETDVAALDKAKTALAALTDGSAGGATLTLSVDVAKSGAGFVDVVTFTGSARWAPVYDLYLTRDATPTLDIERGVLVAQDSGEDWRAVDLTLSTATPNGQGASSDLSPWQSTIAKEEPANSQGESGIGGMAEPMTQTTHEVGAFDSNAALVLATRGLAFSYHFPNPVDLRSDVDVLRLNMGGLKLSPTIIAKAVPALDQTAYVAAELVNDSGETLLPGVAAFYRDGVLVASGTLPAIVAGTKAEVGFGPIDGLRLSRVVPDRRSGDEGILTTSNRQDETAILTIENKTDENWPVRVVDRVPYSEQKDLTITYSADPPVTTADQDGNRGILTWEFDLGAGESRKITLTDTLQWPAGMVLD